MRAEDLMEMAKGFDQIVTIIKSGEVTVQEYRDILNESLGEITDMLNMARALVKGESVEGMGEIQRKAILAQMGKENKKFDYKEHKALIVKLLNMVEDLDNQIGEELFIPFIVDILKESESIVAEVNEDAAKALRKGLKKFYKDRKD